MRSPLRHRSTEVAKSDQVLHLFALLTNLLKSDSKLTQYVLAKLQNNIIPSLEKVFQQPGELRAQGLHRLNGVRKNLLDAFEYHVADQGLYAPLPLEQTQALLSESPENVTFDLHFELETLLVKAIQVPGTMLVDDFVRNVITRRYSNLFDSFNAFQDSFWLYICIDSSLHEDVPLYANSEYAPLTQSLHGPPPSQLAQELLRQRRGLPLPPSQGLQRYPLLPCGQAQPR